MPNLLAALEYVLSWVMVGLVIEFGISMGNMNTHSAFPEVSGLTLSEIVQ